MSKYIESSCKGEEIYTRVWKSENEKSTLQIVHGMCEYVDRYDDFAKYLNEYGITVIGHDHLGHGHSVKSNEDLGYFGEATVDNLIEDIRRVSELRNKDLPYYILGHSMGSFLTRNYIQKYDLDKIIIMGTGHMTSMDGNMLYKLANFYSKIKGERYRGKILNKLTTGSYKKHLKSTDPLSWLSLNEENIRKYKKDPLCNFNFTTNGYKMLGNIIVEMNNVERSGKNKETRIMFYSGDKDPVGAMGTGVKKVYKEYLEDGYMAELNLKEELRHEVLNENDPTVYEEIKDFLIGE